METPPMDEIKTICMECQTHLSGPSNSQNISHGICGPCGVKFKAEIKKAQKQFQNGERK